MRHSWRDVLSALVALSLRSLPVPLRWTERPRQRGRRTWSSCIRPWNGPARTCLPTRRRSGSWSGRRPLRLGWRRRTTSPLPWSSSRSLPWQGTPIPALALGGSMSQTVHYYPMSLLHRDGSWYLSAVPAEHRALLGREITAVNGRSMEEIVEAFAAQVERDLSAGEYRRVVVDLRNNGGGSDGVIWPLLRVLRQAMDRGMEGVEPLEPDVTVPQTMADTLAGRDTAVEWFLPALRWARESGAASGTGEAVQWACAAGLMEIDQGHFRPEEGLTRQEGEAAVERLAALAG